RPASAAKPAHSTRRTGGGGSLVALVQRARARQRLLRRKLGTDAHAGSFAGVSPPFSGIRCGDRREAQPRSSFEGSFRKNGPRSANRPDQLLRRALGWLLVGRPAGPGIGPSHDRYAVRRGNAGGAGGSAGELEAHQRSGSRALRETAKAVSRFADGRGGFGSCVPARE